MDTSERRQSPRHAPSMAEEFVVTGPDGFRAACQLTDLSPFGLRLRFADTATAQAAAAVPSLTMADCPDIWQRLLLGHQCSVVWYRQQECGVQLLPPLTPEEFGLHGQFVLY